MSTQSIKEYYEVFAVTVAMKCRAKDMMSGILYTTVRRRHVTLVQQYGLYMLTGSLSYVISRMPHVPCRSLGATLPLFVEYLDGCEGAVLR